MAEENRSDDEMELLLEGSSSENDDEKNGEETMGTVPQVAVMDAIGTIALASEIQVQGAEAEADATTVEPPEPLATEASASAVAVMTAGVEAIFKSSSAGVLSAGGASLAMEMVVGAGAVAVGNMLVRL